MIGRRRVERLIAEARAARPITVTTSARDAKLAGQVHRAMLRSLRVLPDGGQQARAELDETRRELRRFHRMHGQSSSTIGQQRAQLAHLHEQLRADPYEAVADARASATAATRAAARLLTGVAMLELRWRTAAEELRTDRDDSAGIEDQSAAGVYAECAKALAVLLDAVDGTTNTSPVDLTARLAEKNGTRP